MSRFTIHKLARFVPGWYQLREIRNMANAAMERLWASLTAMYTALGKGGRASIALERLLHALLMQVNCCMRSARRLTEQVQYKLSPCWFIGLARRTPVRVPTVFYRNRVWLIEHDAVIKQVYGPVAVAHQRNPLAESHFSVAVTLIQARYGNNPFVPKVDDRRGGGRTASTGEGFKGQRHSNKIHDTKTNGAIGAYVKGNTARHLRWTGQTPRGYLHSLIADAIVPEPNGFADSEAIKAVINYARQVLGDENREVTQGIDKSYHVKGLIEVCAALKVTQQGAHCTSGMASAVLDAIERPGVSQRKHELNAHGFRRAMTAPSLRPVMARGQSMRRRFWMTLLT